LLFFNSLTHLEIVLSVSEGKSASIKIMVRYYVRCYDDVTQFNE